MFCQKTRHQSYAKVADDDSLRQLADRIQARAVRRMGELLKQFDGRGDHRKNGGAPTSSQREVAEQAGISKDQQVQAVRVANVPAVAITNVIGASTNVIETAERMQNITTRLVAASMRRCGQELAPCGFESQDVAAIYCLT
jgi:hypothetical protein